MSERELTGLIRVGYFGLDWKPQKGFSDPIWIGPKWLGDVIVGHLAKYYCQRRPGTISETNALRYQWFESVSAKALEPQGRRELAEVVGGICRRQTPPAIGLWFRGIEKFSADSPSDPPTGDHFEIITYLRNQELYQRAQEAEHLEDTIKLKSPIAHYVEDAALTVELFEATAEPKIATECYQLATCRGNKTLSTLLFASAIEDAKPRGEDVIENLAVMRACVDKLGVELKDGWQSRVMPIVRLFQDGLAALDPYIRPLPVPYRPPSCAADIRLLRNLRALEPLTANESFEITITWIIPKDGLTMKQIEDNGYISAHIFKEHAKGVIERLGPECGVVLPSVGQRSLKFPLWFVVEVMDDVEKRPPNEKNSEIIANAEELSQKVREAMKPEH